MDSLTHIVLGAGIQTASLGRVQKRKALLYGALLATLPDLDVLSRYADPVSSMTYHRGATHSVFYLTLFALLLTFLIRRFRPNPNYSGRRLFVTVWLILLTHVLMDALTVYGTQIFYPLMLTPASYSALFIIDPLFTLPLLLTFIAVLWRGVSRTTLKMAGSALAWCVVYIVFGIFVRTQAEERVSAAVRARGLPVTAVKGVPLPLNNMVWRVLVKTEDGGYCEGVSSLFDRAPPETACGSLHPQWAQPVAEHTLYQRLQWFTGGWLRHDVLGDELVVSDLRMGTANEQYFRFVFAKRGADGQWHELVPYRYQDNAVTLRGSERQIGRVWRRIWSQQPPLIEQSLP